MDDMDFLEVLNLVERNFNTKDIYHSLIDFITESASDDMVDMFKEHLINDFIQDNLE